VRNLIRPSGKIDRSMGDVHPGGNPHFLYDARAGADIARALGDKLAALDGANAATYKANASALAAKLDAFAQAQTARFAALPDAQRKVVTYHESYPYLLQWLKLDAVATVEPKPGVPPDPAHVAQVLTTMRGANVKVIVQEEYYPSSTSKTLTGMTHAKLVVLPGAARFSEGQSYLDHLTALTNAVFAGVSGAGVSGGAP
jgi:zinc/manganese transport system substrate-binding protein